MAERLNNTIETQINDGNTIVSQITDNNQPLQTVIQDIPQVQTVLQNGINVSSQINAPFVEVTSVNGKTGDVITEPVVGVFEPNHYYLKNTMIGHNNNLYYAKETFTSGSSFNTNDWYSVEGSQITVDSALSSTSENPVQNKVIANALDGKNKTIYTAYNVAPAEDTPEAWKTTLGNNGVYITWYNTTRTFTNQPVQYGFMRTIIGANDIRQDFWAQTGGVHYARTGNYSGWSSYAGTTGVFKNLGAQPGNGTLTIQRNGTNVQTFTANQTGNVTANISVPAKTSEITNDSGFITEIPTASASTLGGIKVGDGLDITSTGTLSTQLGFTTESTSGNTKIIKLQDGATTSYPITTKEAILGLKTYNASWLYDLIYDSTAFTSEQVSELREAILNKDDILIYDGDPTSPTGQTSYYRPVLASTSNTLEFFGLLNISFITAGPNMYSYSFMTTNQGETWTLNANSGGAFLATKYKPGSSFYYTTPSSGCSIMLPGILTTSGTAGKFSINLGAPIIASNVTVNTFKGNIRTSNGGYWINTGYVDGGQNYLNTSGVTVTAGIDGNQVNFLITRSSAQSGTTNNTPMTMELNALSLTFS